MHLVKDDMQKDGVTEDARNRKRWRQMMCCGDP